jgi:protein-tyrosine-phosphatase
LDLKPGDRLPQVKADMAATHFKLLFVCNGNDARSPLAAACTDRLLIETDGEVECQVASAGTHAVDGDGLRPEAEAAAQELSLDLSDHRASVLTAEQCLEPDLILAMSWDQISHIWSLVPEAWEKVFTVKEFVHWAKRAPVRPPILFADRAEQMRDKIIQAHAARKRARADFGFWGGIRPQDLNLIEPNGKGDAAWQALGQAVHALVSDVLTLLLATGDGQRSKPHGRRPTRRRPARSRR